MHDGSFVIGEYSLPYNEMISLMLKSSYATLTLLDKSGKNMIESITIRVDVIRYQAEVL